MDLAPDNGMYTTCKEGEECDDWEASLEYYTEITKKAPWYIKKPYDQCKISYEKFLDLLQQDEQGVGVEINIYDAIEKVYELNSVELAGVLDVSMGVLGYASTQRTIPKRKRQFSSRLHIPESFFDEFLSTQLDALKKCREEFRDCYGDELIEKFKQNGYAAMRQIDLDLPGYHQYWNYAEKKGYSGTAIFAKNKALSVSYGIGIDEHIHKDG